MSLTIWSHAAAMGSFKACNFLAATVAVFLILSAVWIWTHHPRLNVPPRRPLPAGTSKLKKLQGERVLPQSLPRIRTHEKNLEPTPVDRHQLVPSTSYSKLNITFEQIKIDNNCSSVFISLRTTVAFHESRLLLLLLTWLQTVNPKQVQIITDSVNDRWINAARAAGFRVVMSQCAVKHQRLCCKTGHEFEQYYKAVKAGKKYKWYCHFDDDVYVNIPVLMKTLRKHKDKQYLGHWHRNKRYPFHYASGAGYCISSSLMSQLEPFISGSSKFASTCDMLQCVDDVTVGAVIEMNLGYNLTDLLTMLNQAHVTRQQSRFTLKNQVTVAFNCRIHKGVTVPGAIFTKNQDPTGYALWLSVASFPGSSPALALCNQRAGEGAWEQVFCPTIACCTPQHHGAEESKQAHLTNLILKAAFIIGICSIPSGIE